MNPTDRRYSREHEWARPESDSEVTVGISDYAQSELGDIVFVELPTVGSSFAQMDSFGVVESVKAVSDLYSPVSGEVIAVNSELEMAPELVNDDPFGKGWLIGCDWPIRPTWTPCWAQPPTTRWSMSYAPNTPHDQKVMLDAVGVQAIDDLFVDIPDRHRDPRLGVGRADGRDAGA